MNRDDLTHEQAGKLREVIGPQMGYLFRLRERMTKKGFLADDKLYQLVDKAYDLAQPFIEFPPYVLPERGVSAE